MVFEIFKYIVPGSLREISVYIYTIVNCVDVQSKKKPIDVFTHKN